MAADRYQDIQLGGIARHASGAMRLVEHARNRLSIDCPSRLAGLRPDIPQTVVDVLPAEVQAVLDENVASLMEQMIPIYHK